MLLTIPDLRAWARNSEIADDDPWALIVIEAASDLVRETAQQPTWTRESAPPRARQIASHLAARSYSNPDSIEFEGATGPIGGDRRAEEFAKSLHLTEAERLELEGMWPAGSTGGGGGLWVQPVGGGIAAVDGDTYLADDSGSDWMIPYLAEDDIPALG